MNSKSKYPKMISTNFLEYSWVFIAVFFIGSIALGYAGFREYSFLHKDMYLTRIDCFYASMQLISLSSGGFTCIKEPLPWTLQWARFLVPIISAIAVIKAIMSFMREKVDLFKIRGLRRHVVICGLGQMGKSLAEKLVAQGWAEIFGKPTWFRKLFGIPIVLIEINGQNAEISTMRCLRVKVMVGDATEESVLNKVRIGQASRVYVAAGSDESNIAIADTIFHIISDRGKDVQGYGGAQPIIVSSPVPDKNESLQCFVHISDQDLAGYFTNHEIFHVSHDRFDARIFNIETLTAQSILRNNKLNLSFDTDRKDINPHILLIGGGSFGERLMQQIGRYCHYRDSKRKVTLTIVEKVKYRSDHIEKRFKTNLRDYLELRFEPRHGGTLTDEDCMRLQDNYTRPFTGICINVGSQREEMSIAKDIKQCNGMNEIPLLVVTRKSSIFSFLKKVDQLSKQNIDIIDMIELASDYLVQEDPLIDKIARVIHKQYLIFASPSGPTAVSWNVLPEQYKESNRGQALDIPFKLRMIGYDVGKANSGFRQVSEDELNEHLDILAEIEHKRWCVEKIVEGWKHGEILDETEHIHDQLKSYGELDDVFKNYNRNFAKNIPLFLREVEQVIIAPDDPANNESPFVL